MKLITLQKIPNQGVIVTLDNSRYKIQIKSASGFMTYGIERDGVIIIENGNRIVNGAPLLPYKYMESGNFILDVPDSELPDFTRFESTQFLTYASQEKIEAIR
tara:strand:+ start:834 stop:1142 length:309 start_codon:yes stop_codon:yes gene_type:complete